MRKGCQMPFKHARFWDADGNLACVADETVTGREFFAKIMPHFFRETKTIAKTYLRAVSVKYLKLYSSDGEKNE